MILKLILKSTEFAACRILLSYAKHKAETLYECSINLCPTNFT